MSDFYNNNLTKLIDHHIVERNANKNTIPDGAYTVKLTYLDWKDTENPYPILLWEFKILLGEHKDKTLMEESDFNILDHIDHALQNLEQVGMKIEHAPDLLNAIKLKKLISTKLEVDYCNAFVYIKNPIEDQPA